MAAERIVSIMNEQIICGHRVRPGRFLDYGAVITEDGVSFTVHSNQAVSCSLVLFHEGAKEPYVVIPYPDTFRIGNVFSMVVCDLDVEHTEYAFSLDGPYEPEKGLIFDKERYLVDPYAKLLAGCQEWGLGMNRHSKAPYRGKIVRDDFDWGIYSQPNLEFRDMIIYELHVRGFTQHASSRVKHPGTFLGLKEKIPYLLDLGVNAVELMPVFEFDECMDNRMVEGKRLYDYWGYNTVGFFAPNSSYAAVRDYNKVGDELRSLIAEFHKNHIEVILDVVFNHTAEGNEKGPYISFKGFDNQIYYLLTPEGYYYNFSGCGNTLNCNNPIVNDMILDCLRYWVSSYRVDGFRFDLASILGRNEDGSPMSKPPLLERLAYDPVLGKAKLIAEAWDAGGLYQVGSFPSWGRWSEWNGKYRDDLRRFLKGDGGLIEAASNRISGSPDLYDPTNRGEDASVNFLTCHDGFTLYDLYAYNQKHNESNGWNNTDGENNNNSWNCGAEGETEEESVNRLRRRLIKNAFATLMASHGTPMFLAGDEFGSTKKGNNNTYCQDNELSWLDWGLLEKNQEIYRFARQMIHFRRRHPVLRKMTKRARNGFPAISFHGEKAWSMDRGQENRVLGVLFAGWDDIRSEDDVIYLALNMHWEPHDMELPAPPDGYGWAMVADTAKEAGEDFISPAEKRWAGRSLHMEPRSCAVLLAVR